MQKSKSGWKNANVHKYEYLIVLKFLVKDQKIGSICKKSTMKVWNSGRKIVFHDIEIKLKRSEKKRDCRKIDYKTLLVMVSKQSLIPRQITVFKN